MIRVSELQTWLSTLRQSEFVAVDEGGLILETLDHRAHIEIGGAPELPEVDHDDPEDNIQPAYGEKGYPPDEGRGY